MGVKSDGSYGVDADLFYSFPVMVDAAAAGDGAGGRGCGTYSIVAGLDLDTDTATHIAATTRRLRAELDDAIVIDDSLPPDAFDDVFDAASSSPAAEAVPCRGEI